MKSAYDMAMERFGSEPVQQFSEEQKVKLSEIEKKYQSKIAEAEVMSADKIKKAFGEIEVIEQIRQDLIVEIASFRGKAEVEKEKIRKENKS